MQFALMRDTQQPVPNGGRSERTLMTNFAGKYPDKAAQGNINWFDLNRRNGTGFACKPVPTGRSLRLPAHPAIDGPDLPKQHSYLEMDLPVVRFARSAVHWCR